MRPNYLSQLYEDFIPQLNHVDFIVSGIEIF